MGRGCDLRLVEQLLPRPTLSLVTDHLHRPDPSIPQAIPTARSLQHVGRAVVSLEAPQRGQAWERISGRTRLQRGDGREGLMRLRGGVGAEEDEWGDSDAIVLSASAEKAIAMVEKYAVVGLIVR